MPVITAERISTLDDMKNLMSELQRLQAKSLYEFYGALQDFSSKKFLPQWLQKKGIKNVFVSEKGNDILLKINASKKLCAIVYDLETPDLNGLQFLAALGKNPEIKAKCKAILTTPKLTAEIQTKLLQMGAAAIIPKTLTEEALQAAFEKIGLNY
ncbi:MAG: response regulator [Fibromonadaceae bacterium]|nr:response regulator [Fibromonadaceae bacterium]